MADPEKLDPSGANAGRKERAATIKAVNEADAEKAKADQKAADAASKPIKGTTRRTAPRHIVKRDDAGAAEQQRAARDVGLATAVDEFDGPPVVAPIIEDLKKIKIRVLDQGTRKEIDKNPLFEQLHGRVFGEGFPVGEVIIDVRREDGQDHQRFSTWADNGVVDVPLPGLNGPGEWIVHLESPVTQVGEGRDDHLPVIRQSDEVRLSVR